MVIIIAWLDLNWQWYTRLFCTDSLLNRLSVQNSLFLQNWSFVQCQNRLFYKNNNPLYIGIVDTPVDCKNRLVCKDSLFNKLSLQKNYFYKISDLCNPQITAANNGMGIMYSPLSHCDIAVQSVMTVRTAIALCTMMLSKNWNQVIWATW